MFSVILMLVASVAVIAAMAARSASRQPSRTAVTSQVDDELDVRARRSGL